MIEIVKTDKIWYVYLIRTEHGKLYCGSSHDPVARFYKHCQGKGAKFFSTSKPIALVYIEQCESKSHALKRESEIKQLTKYNKEQLVINGCKGFQLPIYNKEPSLTLADILQA
ncbi:GIY-YIG nuclease family protein [Entomomonas sp. E2T0]|uniref:GIY-YIG nuclease family protein n=1 Tax=Entomomonas sp. E2T0 TaxID=2930213 RepID=UPI0029D415E3|nr:GIY-YIG nuclease family protein [Entomomonas sp. E2T0]